MLPMSALIFAPEDVKDLIFPMSAMSSSEIDDSNDQQRCLEDKHQLYSFWGILSQLFLLKNRYSEIPIHTYKDYSILNEDSIATMRPENTATMR